MDNDKLQAIEKLLFRVGAEVVNEAKEIAPYKTGDLKRDIQVFDEHINKGEVSIGNSLLAKYAPYVHYGTGRQAKGKSKAPKKKGQKAQPYLSDGLNNYIRSGGFDRAINDCGNEISEEIFKGLKDSLKNISIK